MTWIESYGGRAVDLLVPRPESVSVRDVAHSIARINRFTGHHEYPSYSVAEHAIHVCKRVIELHPGEPLLHALALHHDDGEYVTGDVSAPMKFAMRVLADEMGFTKSPFDIIEERVQAAVLQALGLPTPTPEQHAIIKTADRWMLQVERWSLLPNTGKHGWGTNEGKPPGYLQHVLNTSGWRDAKPTEIEARFLAWSQRLLAALPVPP